MPLRPNSCPRTALGPGSVLVLTAILIFAVHPAALASEPPDPAKSIEGLLNDAEGALLGKQSAAPEPATPPAAEKKKRVKHRYRAKEEDSPSPFVYTPRLEPKPSSVSELAPIDSTAIQKVIAVDLQASQREREPMYPVTMVSLSAGIHTLSPTYSLTKDDDIFSDPSGGGVKGLYLTFSPMWKIGFLETANVQTFVAAVVGTGYSQGDVLMQRAGVQNSLQLHGVKLLPIDAGAQVSVLFWKRVGIFMGYGPGAEIFHQDGQGATDSVTEFFYGDEAWLGISGKVSQSIDLLITYKKKGTNLLVRSTFGGQLIEAGLSFGLSG